MNVGVTSCNATEVLLQDLTPIARNFEEYKMQFKARDAGNIRVDVDFRLSEKMTGMHVYDSAEQAPTAAATQR